MAAKPMDALGSFAYLLDNIDTWTTKIRDLAQHVEQRHEDFAAEYTRLLHHARAKRVKSPSVTSINTRDEIDADIPVVETSDHNTLSPAVDLIEINPLEAGNKFLFAQTQKKRKPDGSIRSGASGPQKFRSKNHVVIYYDSMVQDELDKMFKAIVLARNNLRKGKNALTASTGFQLPTIRNRFDGHFTQRPDFRPKETTTSQASASPYGGGKPRIPEISQVVMNDHEIAIVQTDKNLETVQTLCETAAHQFLRDGDCKAELAGILLRFDAVLTQSKLTAEALRKEKEEKEVKDLSSSDISVQTDDRTSNAGSESTLCTKSSLEGPLLSAGRKFDIDLSLEKSLHKIQAPAITALRPSLGLSNLEIEVDDTDSEQDVDLDLSKYRRAFTTRAIRAS